MEMSDSPLFHLLPLTLPWSVLYFSLLRCPHPLRITHSVANKCFLYYSLWEGCDVAMETNTEPSIDVVMETETKDPPVVAVETEVGVSPPLTTNDDVLGEGCRVSSTRWGLQFLCEIHDHLGGGGQGWCVGDRGRILSILVARLREELRQLTAHPPKTREVLIHHVYRLTMCLLSRLCCVSWNNVTTVCTAIHTRKPRYGTTHTIVLHIIASNPVTGVGTTRSRG